MGAWRLVSAVALAVVVALVVAGGAHARVTVGTTAVDAGWWLVGGDRLQADRDVRQIGVHLRNDTGTPSGRLALTVAGRDAGAFVVDRRGDCVGRQIPSHGGCFADVEVRPADNGPLQATLTIAEEDGTTAQVALRALGSLVELPPGAPAGSAEEPASVVVRWPAGRSGILRVDGLEVEGNAGVDEGDCRDRVLHPGDACRFQVVAAPCDVATSAVVRVLHDSPGALREVVVRQEASPCPQPGTKTTTAQATSPAATSTVAVAGSAAPAQPAPTTAPAEAPAILVRAARVARGTVLVRGRVRGTGGVRRLQVRVLVRGGRSRLVLVPIRVDGTFSVRVALRGARRGRVTVRLVAAGARQVLAL